MQTVRTDQTGLILRLIGVSKGCIECSPPKALIFAFKLTGA